MTLRSAFQNLPSFLSIDTIKSYARKKGRIEKISSFFELKNITENSKVFGHLKTRIEKDETITGGLHVYDSII